MYASEITHGGTVWRASRWGLVLLETPTSGLEDWHLEPWDTSWTCQPLRRDEEPWVWVQSCGRWFNQPHLCNETQWELHIPTMHCSPQEKVTTSMDLSSIHTESHLVKEMWPRRKHWLTLQYCCLETPMDRGTGRLQSIGSQRVGRDWSDLALDHKLVHQLFYLLSKIYQYF